MNPAETNQTNSLNSKIADDPICRCGKIQNDSILPNSAETVWKNLLKFADDPILPMWMNQAKTIWKSSLKLQMTLFCCCYESS